MKYRIAANAADLLRLALFSLYHPDSSPEAVMEAGGQLWYNLRKPQQIGLAAPVASLLAELATMENSE